MITLLRTVLLPTPFKMYRFLDQILRNVGGKTPYFNNSALLHLIKKLETS